MVARVNFPSVTNVVLTADKKLGAVMTHLNNRSRIGTFVKELSHFISFEGKNRKTESALQRRVDYTSNRKEAKLFKYSFSRNIFMVRRPREIKAPSHRFSSTVPCRGILIFN